MLVDDMMDKIVCSFDDPDEALTYVYHMLLGMAGTSESVTRVTQAQYDGALDTLRLAGEELAEKGGV